MSDGPIKCTWPGVFIDECPTLHRAEIIGCGKHDGASVLILPLTEKLTVFVPMDVAAELADRIRAAIDPTFPADESEGGEL